jgi:hypothetical protein
MSDSKTSQLRITPDGMFYIAWGQIRHFARKEAIQEIIFTDEGFLVTLLGAGADQFEIGIPFVQGQELLLDMMMYGWPTMDYGFRQYLWTIEDSEIPF